MNIDKIAFNPMDPTAAYDLRQQIQELRAEQNRKIIRALLRLTASGYSWLGSHAAPSATRAHRFLFRLPTHGQAGNRLNCRQ